MPSTQTICTHCSTPFTPRGDEVYCCHGCDYVAQLLSDNDLTRFYELKGDTVVPPVGSRPFSEIDVPPLITQVEQIEQSSESNILSSRFSIEGISCIGCVWLIEAIFMRQSGSARIRIDPRSSAVEMDWHRGQFDIADFAQSLQNIGYRLSLYDADRRASSVSRQLGHRLGLCGFFLMNTMLFTLPKYLGMGQDFFLAALFGLLAASFATLSLLIGGGYFIQRAWQAIQNRVLHIDLPIAAGLLAAYAGSVLGWVTGYLPLVYFDFVATFVFLMLLGRWLQEYALEKNRTHLQRQKTGPRKVTLLGGERDGQSIAASDVEAGMHYSLAPGEINPVAADPLDPQGTLSLEWINGEAEPIIWPEKRTAPAGAINVGLHSMRFCAREAWADSLLAQLLQRPEDNFQAQRLQRILKHYIASVLIIAALGSLLWILLSGDLLKATQVLISVLIVSCPCALGIALPMCDEFANARLRRSGLFIKSNQIWERLRRVRTVVFDKTGTLTMDIPRLRNPEAVRALEPFAVEALHQLVEQNRHPIARSLRETLLAAHSNALTTGSSGRASSVVLEVTAVEEHIGQGVCWTDPESNEWTLGKPAWRRPELEVQKSGQAAAQSMLRRNGSPVASFEFQEDVRDDARSAINTLRRQPFEIIILSGDAPERVTPIAMALGIEAQAECSPQDKADWIQRHAAGQALMIGDGANDSLAFDAAACRGTPVVDKSILEASADFFFFGRSLRSLPELIQVAHRRRTTVTAIFAVAVIYNIVAVGICLAGLMHPLLAAILMPLSSLFTLAMAWFGLGRRKVPM
ncbi:MAG: HAD family hydrolase [Puniceicoccaceae bacterium]|nr:MAG: HAD family hydrolase [Puniceicoccaceae bacterium]